MDEKLRTQDKKEQANIQEVPDEAQDFYSDDSLYNINSWGADFTFREIVQMYDDDDIVKPEIQRHYVWDRAEASRFIDSILLGLPLPSIFLAKTETEQMLIIDGFQRTMTVRDFMKGYFGEERKKVFKLTNSEKINERWRGKAFIELTDKEQRKIKQTTIHSIIFVQAHPYDDDTSYYQIFERINSTGRPLLAQEIRNCVYQGQFNSLLIELNRNELWRELYGLTEVDSRMRDIEFILRYFALASERWRYNRMDGKGERLQGETLRGVISLKKFFNLFMDDMNRQPQSSLISLANEFIALIDVVTRQFGPTAFRNVSKTKPDELAGKFNPTIFDSIMIATLFAGPQPQLSGEVWRARQMNLLHDPEYQNLILIKTTNRERIAQRISKAAHHLYGFNYEE